MSNGLVRSSLPRPSWPAHVNGPELVDPLYSWLLKLSPFQLKEHFFLHPTVSLSLPKYTFGSYLQDISLKKMYNIGDIGGLRRKI